MESPHLHPLFSRVQADEMIATVACNFASVSRNNLAFCGGLGKLTIHTATGFVS